MKKILIMVNRDFVLYNFRIELVEKLLYENYEVYISLPDGDLVRDMEKLGCRFIETKIDRRGTNPIKDLLLLISYMKLCRKNKPDYIFTYTIKPNLYGAIVARLNHIPCIMNISGLGTALENGGLLQKITVRMYRIAARYAKTVFIQNQDNYDFCMKHNIAVRNGQPLLVGSGVNLERFSILPYPIDDKIIEFSFIARVIKEKGIDEYIEAARVIRRENPGTIFHVLGPSDSTYKSILLEETKKGTIIWHGMISDIRQHLKISHLTIHPSYYPEGISNACLESAASGRPVITTARSGCRETVDDGKSGYICVAKDVASLVDAIKKFIHLPWIEKEKMGLAGRQKMEREFDRQVVIEKYMKEIEVKA